MGRTGKRLLGILISSHLLVMAGLSVVGGPIDTATAQVTQVNKYLINYYVSYNSVALDSPGRSEASITVVTVTSISQSLCQVAVVWRNEIGSEICTTNSTRLLPGGTEHHCSRPIMAVSGKPVCLPETTCPAPLDGQEGSILVRVDPSCENQIGVDARVLYTVVVPSDQAEQEQPGPATEIILGTHSPSITKINSASLE